jgi:hypothetical protein
VERLLQANPQWYQREGILQVDDSIEREIYLQLHQHVEYIRVCPVGTYRLDRLYAHVHRSLE